MDGNGGGSCELEIRPADAAQWDPLTELFGERGACGGCWCMWWRKSRSQFDRDKGEPNRADLRQSVAADERPGLLAYHDRQPVGWIAVAPREQYPVAARSVVARALTGEPGSWLISCLFIRRDHRRHGHAVQLVLAAAQWAFEQGATTVQAIPVDASTMQADAFIWTGIASTFTAAGFTEVARRRPTRPLMELRPDR